MPFFCTNTYACSLSMYKFSVTNLIIWMLHKKDKNLTQIQQRKSLFQSVYLSFLYTSHMNTYVYENLYTYTLSICLYENIFSDFFELWKRYFGWEMYIELSGARPLRPLFAWYVLYRGLRVPDTRTILLEIHNLREKKYRR